MPFIGTALTAIGTALGASSATAAGVGLAAVSTAASVGVGLASSHAASKASSQQAEAEQRRMDAQGRLAKLQSQKAVERQVRASRIQRAQNIASATVGGGGITGSSGLQGTISGIGSQAASNIAFTGKTNTLQSLVAQEDNNIFNIKSDLTQKQSIFGAMGNIVGAANQISGGTQTLGKALFS